MAGLLRQATGFSLLRMKADVRTEVNLLLTDDKGIRRLNRVYRGIDRATDVLSFAYGDNPAADVLPFATGLDAAPNAQVGAAMSTGRQTQSPYPAILGDIVISTERAAAQALAYGHSYEREMAFLTVHGILHLLGMDHETEDDRVRMERLQRQILRATGQPRRG